VRMPRRPRPRPAEQLPAPSPAWGVRSTQELRWPASLALLGALLLYVALPPQLTPLRPPWLVPALEALLLVPLALTGSDDRGLEPRLARAASITLIGVVSIVNLAVLDRLIELLLHGGRAGGRELVFSAIGIWLTNVLIFGLWYWELDRGGPAARTRPDHRQPDFLFPQMATPEAAPIGWTPSFVDYLYVSFTNSTAFSPTDTMPLTITAKALMLVQALASLLTVALVAARAVNILS
jgi:uncharacterized membrane protein